MIHDNLYAYGRIRGFLTTHTCLSEEVKGPAVPQDLDLYCDFCDRFQTETSPCEHSQLFSAGWKEGAAQAEQIDLERDFGYWSCRWFHAPFVLLAIIVGSMPSMMELMPNCTARPSDALSAVGGRQVEIGDVSKGCSSRLFSCISQLRCLVQVQETTCAMGRKGDTLRT
jgi:hypothetical protein